MVWVRSNMWETLDTSETSQMAKQVIHSGERSESAENTECRWILLSEESSLRRVQYSSTLTAELFGAWQLKELLLQEYQAWQPEELQSEDTEEL